MASESDPRVNEVIGSAAGIVEIDRMKLSYPIPLSLHDTTGDDYFFTGPPSDAGQEGTSQWPETADGKKVLAAYNPVDYRLFITASKDETGQYTDLAAQFDGRDRFNRLLRSLGSAGEKTEVMLSEIVDNYMGNVDDYTNRWFVLTQQGEGDDMILELEYFCFEPVSDATYRKFQEELLPPPVEQGEARETWYKSLAKGREGGTSAGESRRGIRLMGALALDGGIERVSHTPGTDNPRGTRLWLVVDHSDPGENPISEAELLDSFGDWNEDS